MSAIRDASQTNKRPQRFYLPADAADPAVPRLVAELADLHGYLSVDYEGLCRRVVRRLSAEALRALQARVAYFFGRYAENELLHMDEEEAGFQRGLYEEQERSRRAEAERNQRKTQRAPS